MELASPDVAYGVVRSSALTAGGNRKRFLDPEYYVIQVCRIVGKVIACIKVCGGIFLFQFYILLCIFPCLLRETSS